MRASGDGGVDTTCIVSNEIKRAVFFFVCLFVLFVMALPEVDAALAARLEMEIVPEAPEANAEVGAAAAEPQAATPAVKQSKDLHLQNSRVKRIVQTDEDIKA